MPAGPDGLAGGAGALEYAAFVGQGFDDRQTPAMQTLDPKIKPPGHLGTKVGDPGFEYMGFGRQGQSDRGIPIDDRVGQQFSHDQNHIVDEILNCLGGEYFLHHATGLPDHREIVRQVPADGTGAVSTHL